MLVGVPKEIKDNEFRVGMTPASVAELVHHGHAAIVETRRRRRLRVRGRGVCRGAGAELVDDAGRRSSAAPTWS